MKFMQRAILLVICGVAFALGVRAESPESLIQATAAGAKVVEVARIRGVRYVLPCAGRKCEAFKAVLRAKKIRLVREQDENGIAISAASSFCRQAGGQAVILSDAQRRQYDYCRFDDGSMVEAHDLHAATGRSVDPPATNGADNGG